jgi:hypothetical protein
MENREGPMRIVAVGIAAVLAVCVADSALAAKKKVPLASPAKFDKCYQDSIKASSPPGQSGHREFMMQCMYGIITGRPSGQ